MAQIASKRNEAGMRKYISILLLYTICSSIYSQDYLTGKLVDAHSNKKQIFYDRTLNEVSKNIFQSLYTIYDKDKSKLFTVSLVHQRLNSIILVTIKGTGLSGEADTIEYNSSQSGVILSNYGDLDTTFILTKPYKYLLSFTDAFRDYPIVHKISLGNNQAALLDPITRIRLKKQKQICKEILSKFPNLKINSLDAEQEEKQHNELFRTRLVALRDSMYSRNALLAQRVEKIRKDINTDISIFFKTKKVFPDAQRYEGAKKNGVAEGNGLFMSNGNYYDGYFINGKFISGTVIIHYDGYEYCGNYSLDSLNGIGWLKFKNESYLLGDFRNGVLYSGITFSISKSGEVYFGNSKNGQRTGYGELYTTKGQMYYGEFLNGSLIKGYSKDADPFGFYTYSKIENGIKTPIETQVGEEFFKPFSGAKQAEE